MEKQEKGLRASGAKCLLLSYNSAVILVLLLIFGAFFVDRFGKSLSTIVVETSIYGFIAVGLALVMITGNIDLSVGFLMGACAVTTIAVADVTGSVVLGVIAALAAGALMGAINGFTVTKLGISPLIATIATSYIFKGFVYYFTKDGSYYPTDAAVKDTLKSSIAGLKFFDMKAFTLTVVVFVVLLVLLALMMRKTRFGNNLYITGDNAEAGALAGIKTGRVQFAAYVLCGLFCALAGVFFASKAGAAVYTQGEGRDVFAISACVIGGIKMAGGKGTALNVLLGILIMRVISTGMNLMLLPASWVDFASGALLVIILIIDRFTATNKNG